MADNPKLPLLNSTDDVMAFLRAQGLGAQVDEIQKRVGINFERIDKALACIIGTSPSTAALKSTIRKLAPHPHPVLIQGDTGTGKELVARALAANSSGPFVALNCAGMPRELVESELFGYAKGSFTGAHQDRPGLFSVAGDGTLFLDEIGDMPLDMQAKLLRVLQERTVRPVGSVEEKPIKCRFVAATHMDLRQCVVDKHFRTDLYARLSTFIIHLAPLSERPEDAAAIWDKLNAGHKKPISGTQIDWSKVDLSFNVRSVQQLYDRYLVLDERPQLCQNS